MQKFIIIFHLRRNIIKVCLFSRTPLAAAPWELYKALKKYTALDVNLINGTARYNDGRTFPHHLLLTSSNGDAMRILQESDLWHVHNYLMPQLVMVKRAQKVIAQFHSLPRQGNWQSLMDFADVSYTIRQPNQEKEYKLKGLPNIIDPDEYRPIQCKPPIKIAFAPSTRMPIGNPMSKGYNEVKAILNIVARKRDIEIVWIERKSYVENLEMKQQSHILIDDVVTGNWHRTSLEGMCFGCAVLNKVTKSPFVYATVRTLEERLLWLVDNPEILNEFQERSRFWILQHWHAMDQVKEYVNAYKEVLQ
ncbi:MAG: hypothetical protein KAV87_52120 [Desulfobacteraceae bacterium]|nr:hypothetical protein [Desulfobacteraceae bacterium]